MPIDIIVSNEASLRKLRKLLGAKDENEAVEIAIEKIVTEFEQKLIKDLPEEFFRIYRQNQIAEKSPNDFPDASLKNSEEDPIIDAHSLKRIPPKNTFEVTANFKVGGRRKPMKYDFSDFEEDNNL